MFDFDFDSVLCIVSCNLTMYRDINMVYHVLFPVFCFPRYRDIGTVYCVLFPVFCFTRYRDIGTVYCVLFPGIVT